MKNPKAEEVRRLYRNISTELKLKLDKNLTFALQCLDYFCRSLKRKSKNLPEKKFKHISKFVEKLKQIHQISSSRQIKIVSSQNNNNTTCSLKKEVSDQRAKFEELFFYFPKLKESRIEYLKDSKILSENDVVDLLSKWKIHDQLFLDNHTLKWCLDFLLEEKEEWEGKLKIVDKMVSELALLVKEDYTSMLRIEFHKVQKRRYSKFVKETQVQVDTFQSHDYQKQKSKSGKLKSLDFYLKIFGNSPFYIHNSTLLQPIDWIPSLVQETFKKQKEIQRKRMSSLNKAVQLEALYNLEREFPQKNHLIVLVHGESGSHRDMKLYRRFLGMILPNALCLSAKSLKNYKTKCMVEMAKDLANEIIFTVKKQPNISQISFVAHTLGGIVARASLPFLLPFKQKMSTFLSLGTPHLGLGTNAKSLLNTSKMFFLGGILKNKVEDQLNMSDAKNPRDSFLFQLAVNDKLHWFENIILVDSDDHLKVSTQSARIECSKEKGDRESVTNEMARLIWEEVNNDVIVRVDVDLEDPQRYFFTDFIF